MSSSKYNPTEIETPIYETWESQSFFEPQDQGQNKYFSIMMPPPNVTGSLHIGHALTFTLQDIMVRYKRMDGYKTLWQPGTDHASIAVENILEKQLAEEGLKKEDIGRKKFLERAWEWKEYSGGTIVKQLRKLGVSPAWSRERFTMDEGLSQSVRRAFVALYNEGNIYKGNYLVNWCTKCGALSDIEVEYEEHQGNFFHIKYHLVDEPEKYIVVATTRPETYFGDTAVMVHPQDERYKDLIGKRVLLPFINKEIEIIADEHVDPEFGTGIVKVTPAHDVNDYEVGKRHHLEFVTIFNEKGVLNHHCGEFEGLEVKNARETVVKKLQDNGFIEKIEDHLHQIGHCYRCNNVIEPYISKQWFLKKEVAENAIKKVNDGEAKFFPPSWKNNYDAWMSELRDWCISRQLYWGHHIPVFYCESCNHEWADEEENPKECPHCSKANFHQDPDVLDTWFSSALWPFSTLGWGNEHNGKVTSNDLKEFYPNSLLITGFDILFFWVARMLMMGVHFLEEVPFKDIYLHALVRDEKGNKMSKSKGNVIDPLDMIEEFGADTLRFTLCALAVQGRDIKLSGKHLEQYRNFGNKIFNAHNYLKMKQESFKNIDEIEFKTGLGKYMLSRFYLATEEIRKNLDSYRYNDGALTIYKFMWNEFCDWGIELSKVEPDSIPELGAIFKESLKLLHPFMPFLSENLYHKMENNELKDNNSIMVMQYPESKERNLEIEKEFELIIDAIVSLRRAKVPIDMANKKINLGYVKLNESKSIDGKFIERLAKVEKVEFVSEKVANCVADVSDNLETYIPTESVDLKPIIDRLSKQIEKLNKEKDKLEGMLNNENFVKNAPQEVLDKNREGLENVLEHIERVDRELKSLIG